ncbi:unnamed protein product [Colletotrichum noveboracense]|uniref:Methyltransferase domain-containing protein n=1 Tax=Colletotrichum noveboracense TaxID=2664923 RepID=A0A9W4RL40_9PEZI|nr:unnamed protein product [Colletotrichum noveboracense]
MRGNGRLSADPAAQKSLLVSVLPQSYFKSASKSSVSIPFGPLASPRRAMANAAQDVPLVPDDQFDNTDSEAEVQSLISDSTSLRSSILQNRIENGRTYHKYKDGKYAWPNDEEENDRLDMQNEICFLTFHNRLGFAPSCDEGAKVNRVLDLGTGTGLWAIEYADAHPEAEVLGVDLSPIQPQDVPPNLKFEIDDVEEEWLYSQKFDYIHLRFLNGSIADWKKLIKNAYESVEMLCLKNTKNHCLIVIWIMEFFLLACIMTDSRTRFTQPGGYFEIQEGDFVLTADDDTMPPEKPLAKFASLIREACVKFGREFVPVPLMERMMTEAGFEDVVLQRFKWPSNPWPKDPYYKKIGEWNFHNFVDAAEAMAIAPLTRAHGYTKEEVQVFLIDVRKNMRDPSIHSYMPIYTIVGKKPLKQSTPAPAAETTPAEG